ncbi:MAG: DMT family transporter [Cephaloticoccus sp.]|nr:DMT family transporter [Cephaloticoccus sp.]MCF7760139.1 DMT family transporter [Cephaloticoccus sp.]
MLIPLVCGLLYVLGMLTLKRASELGVGVWRVTFFANWACALMFLPWWWHTGFAPVAWSDYWQPAVSGLIFLVAQVLMFLAITRGDVSVAAPVMGIKVILVALFSTMLLVGRIPLQWWLGAGLSSTAVMLLNFGGASRHRKVGQTILLTTASAVLFALSDVLIQLWAPAWGQGNYFPPLFLAVGLYSFGLLRFAHGGLFDITTRAWRWVLPGALLNALTNGGIALTLGIWGNATAVNIVYSSRGLFSVLLVWLAGHWFANTESHVGRVVLISRLIGATAMLVAIGLVLL